MAVNLHNKNAAKVAGANVARQIAEAFGFPAPVSAHAGPDATHDYVIRYYVAPTKTQAKAGRDVVVVSVSRTREGTGFAADGLNVLSIEAVDGPTVVRGGAIAEGVIRSQKNRVGEATLRKIARAKPAWFRRCKPEIKTAAGTRKVFIVG